MNEQIKKKVEDIVQELRADGYEKGVDWEGYETYEPIFNEPTFIGYTLILVKGEEVKEATNEEAMNYYNYADGIKATTKTIEELRIEQAEKLS